jgi:hypothetical protein
MALPLQLSDWTFDLIRRIADYFEQGWFDFKEVLKGRDPNHSDRIREAACAMANTDGGFLVFGVVDRGNRKPGQDPVPGIPLTGKEELRQDFGHLAQGIKRGIWFDSSPKAIAVDPAATRGVFVVHVPRSPLRPHELKGRFPKRGEGGSSVDMDFYEVREQMLNTEERFSKLTLLRIQLDQLRTVCNFISTVGNDHSVCTIRFETGAINPLIAETCTLFPPGNQLLKDLGTMVTKARQCNELLENLNHEGLNMPQGIDPRVKAEWLQTIALSGWAVSETCRKAEEALEAIYGKVKP